MFIIGFKIKRRTTGFEPANSGATIHCLTTWPRPPLLFNYMQIIKTSQVKNKFIIQLKQGKIMKNFLIFCMKYGTFFFLLLLQDTVNI